MFLQTSKTLKEGVLVISLLSLVAVQHGSTSSPELKTLVEGDMFLNKFQLRNLAFRPRNGMMEKKYRWPKNKHGKVIVPYKFNETSAYSDQQKSIIRSALDGIQKVTCIQFEESKSAPDYINIWSDKGCSASVGRQGGAQGLSLNKEGCLTEPSIQHEVIHALGFQHMHQTHERDKHVKIHKQNIKSGSDTAFDIPKVELSLFGTPYDFDSLMHYNGYGFAKDPKVWTMETIDPKNQAKIDLEPKKMSPGDIQRINNMYECNKPKPDKPGKHHGKKPKSHRHHRHHRLRHFLRLFS